MNPQPSDQFIDPLSRLRFDVESGNIWLDEHRLLLHTNALGSFRKELLNSLGAERARGLLVRMGFASGQQDAELAKKLVGADRACWTQIGYASGYVTAFMNRFVVFKEVDCIGKGDRHCSIIGQLLELQEEVAQLRASLHGGPPAGNPIGASPGFKAAYWRP